MKSILMMIGMLFFGSFFQAADGQAAVTDAIKYLPVQDAGRVKPFDTFARESLRLVYGKTTFNGRSASDVVMTWMLIPEYWQEVKFIQIRHNGLREALRFSDQEEVYYSPQELMSNDRVGLLIQELRVRRERKEKLNPYFQAIQTLESQLTTFHAIRLGEGVRVMPPKEGTTWLSIKELSGEAEQKFMSIAKRFVEAIGKNFAAAKEAQPPTASDDVRKALELAVDEFVELAGSSKPELYPQLIKTRVEVHYNNFHPFRWAWISYLLAIVFLLFSWRSPSGAIYRLAWFMAIIGLLLHAYGMGLRVYLTGRAPVSNMYETVIWVPWVSMVIAMILERLQNNRIILLCTGLATIFCLILSDMAPAVLDSSLQPLEPVLRDNFWLMTHVLIITASYAAFLVAWAIGNTVLIYYLRGEEKFKTKIANANLGLYRAIQIGVVLLAAGTILGGIWADYSWGRFWGWDPKETWALIALLGYLAILHGRLVGWVKQFALAVSAVLAFALVIMAWYGVNFVLGAGLHTYGFGAGGVEYVAVAVGLQILFVAYVATVRHSRQRMRL